jgi:hypothetical protein
MQRLAYCSSRLYIDKEISVIYISSEENGAMKIN